MRIPRASAIALLVLAMGCDRNIEPFDASEQPREPDLSKIFPEGAERATRVEPGLPPPPSDPPPSQAAGGGGEQPLSGTLRLADGLEARPGSILFLIARRGAAGPPLAVKRVADPSFPLDFTIGPDDRMIEAMPFAGPLQLSARVDGDGDASSREPGDLQGSASGTYDPGATGIDLLIDEQL